MINDERPLTENDAPKEPVEMEIERFLHVLGHDLQQPLSKIITISELLLMKLKNLDETEKDYLARMYEAGKDMRKLIEDRMNSQLENLRSISWQTPKKK